MDLKLLMMQKRHADAIIPEKMGWVAALVGKHCCLEASTKYNERKNESRLVPELLS